MSSSKSRLVSVTYADQKAWGITLKGLSNVPENRTVCAGLSSAGNGGEDFPGSGHPHLLDLAAGTARHPSDRHGGIVHQRRPANLHPQGDNPGSRAPTDLPGSADF